MTSEDTVEDPLMSVEFHIQSKSFSIYRANVTVHLLFQCLLQKTLKSVFLLRYESLKLNYDTKYLMTSEETVKDLLMRVQFYIKRKSFFPFRVTVHILFSFLLQRRLNPYFYHAMNL